MHTGPSCGGLRPSGALLRFGLDEGPTRGDLHGLRVLEIRLPPAGRQHRVDGIRGEDDAGEHVGPARAAPVAELADLA